MTAQLALPQLAPVARPGSVWNVLVRNPLAVFSLLYLAVMTIAAVAAPLFAPYDPTGTDFDHVLSGPSSLHPLGTDKLGRDVLSRIFYGGRVSLVGVGEAVLTLLVLGVLVGLLAGFLGGWVDRIASWLIDMMLAVPIIVMLLVVLAVFGNNETAAMVAFGVLAAPGLARVVRSATFAVRQELYISAARVAGLPAHRIIIGQVLPRVWGPIVVQSSLLAGSALLAETGLGYLGLGVQPPTPTWGGLVADASHLIDQQPWLLVPTGLAIGLAVLSFGLLGDAVRDAAAGSRSRMPSPPRRKPRPKTTAAEPIETDERAGLLSLRGVSVTLGGNEVVADLALDIAPGETVGLVGESGCGKSMTGRAVLGLLPAGGQVTGSVRFDSHELVGLAPRSLRKFRGCGVALVSQEPAGSLDPVQSVGQQLGELVRRHDRVSGKGARARALELLTAVRLPDPETVLRRYPHQLSGGMAQRVAIAMALAGRPKLLIADEPTTALDVTVQAEILDLLRTLQRETGMAILLVSHDWGAIADLCNRAYVMYAGEVVETGPVAKLFRAPRHPYTAGLLGCAPGDAQPRTALRAIEGTVPDPGHWPPGCRFAPRCPLAGPDCESSPVPVFELDPARATRCLHHTAVAKESEHDTAGIPT